MADPHEHEHRGHDHAGHDHGHGHDEDVPDCESALEELYLFLDGELTDERRVTIRSHLDGCSPCFEAFDFEAELRIVIAHRCKDSVPDQLRDRIASLLSEPAGPAEGE
jgi:mycothiol system anti-sigma-R factor